MIDITGPPSTISAMPRPHPMPQRLPMPVRRTSGKNARPDHRKRGISRSAGVKPTFRTWRVATKPSAQHSAAPRPHANPSSAGFESDSSAKAAAPLVGSLMADAYVTPQSGSTHVHAELTSAGGYYSGSSWRLVPVAREVELACASRALCRASMRGEHATRLRCGSFLPGFHPGVMIGVFLAVDRRHMRGISVEIGPADAEFLAVVIDPFPDDIAGNLPLRPRCAVDTYDIGRKPVTVAATEAAAVVRPVVRRLEAACNRLAIVVAETAGDPR